MFFLAGWLGRSTRILISIPLLFFQVFWAWHHQDPRGYCLQPKQKQTNSFWGVLPSESAVKFSSFCFLHVHLNSIDTTALSPSLGHDTIDFIDKNCAWLIEASQFEKNTDKLFTFTSPFGDNRWSWDVEEGCFALSSDGFCQHCLKSATKYFSSSWRTVKQNSFPSLSYSHKALRILQRKSYSLHDQRLCSIEPDDVLKPHIRVLHQNVSGKIGR